MRSEGLRLSVQMSKEILTELSLNFEVMDSQHRELLELLEVARIASARGDLPATQAAVSTLGDALVSHFASEEALMAETFYPDRARHKAAHDIFMQDFGQLGQELASGLTDLTTHWLSTRVAEWIRFHIRVNDAPLAEFLTARQARGQPVAPRQGRRPS